MATNALQIDYRTIASIKPYAGTARTHSRRQKEKLKTLLLRFGQLTPILIDTDDVVIDGHEVLAQWAGLGNDEIAVVIAPSREPADIRALRLALNRLPQEAGWDQAQLKVEFETLIELGFDMELTAFDAVEIDMSLAIDEPSSGEVEDAPPAPAEGPAISRSGDIWLLGQHKIACGDARDQGLMDRLLGSATIDIIFSDPPYNVAICGFVSGTGRHREFACASGEMGPAEFTVFLDEAFRPAAARMREGAVAYLCIDWRHIEELLAAARKLELSTLNLCVWAKTNPGMGSLYRSQHELVWVFRKGEAAHLNNVELGKHGRARSNVWTYRGMSSFGANRDELLGSHPTVKPVLLVADAIKDTSRRGDLVFDPFLGSGTTLVAAQRTGRRCYGVELDPLYVDVIIRRWEAETGKDAILEESGDTFAARGELRPALPAAQPLLLAAPTTVEG